MDTMPTSSALLFPGQGSHSEGMHEPFEDHPLLKRGIELLGFDPFSQLAEGTRTQQPALFLCSMAQWASREDHETDPLAAAGHSLGEYAALTAAGAIDFEDGVRLVRARAEAMADAAARQPGGMVALLGGDRDDVYELAAELGLSLANDNAPGQIVLSGRMRGIDAAVRRAAFEQAVVHMGHEDLPDDVVAAQGAAAVLQHLEQLALQAHRALGHPRR